MSDNSPVFIERRKRVLDQITSRPETHDQGTFETQDPCGTTRCIAGWAIHFEKPHLPSHTAMVRLAYELDVTPSYKAVAGRLLGLSGNEAYQLFFDSDDEESVELLREYAESVE